MLDETQLSWLKGRDDGDPAGALQLTVHPWPLLLHITDGINGRTFVRAWIVSRLPASTLTSRALKGALIISVLRTIRPHEAGAR